LCWFPGKEKKRGKKGRKEQGIPRYAPPPLSSISPFRPTGEKEKKRRGEQLLHDLVQSRWGPKGGEKEGKGKKRRKDTIGAAGPILSSGMTPAYRPAVSVVRTKRGEGKKGGGRKTVPARPQLANPV